MKQQRNTSQPASFLDFPGGAVTENPPASAGDAGPIPGLSLAFNVIQWMLAI